MNGSYRISLRCPGCNAKLRAPLALAGRTCTCPGCKTRVVVRVPAPTDSDVALVPLDLSRRGDR